MGNIEFFDGLPVLPDRSFEESTAFASLMGNFHRLKSRLYSQLDGFPEREVVGALGRKTPLLVNSRWMYPKGIEIEGFDQGDNLLLLVKQLSTLSIRVQKHDLDRKLMLPYHYEVWVGRDRFPKLVMGAYLPTQRGITDFLGNTRDLRELRMLDIHTLYYQSEWNVNSKEMSSPENVLLGIIRRNPALSLRFMDWFFGGLLNAEEVESVNHQSIKAA